MRRLWANIAIACACIGASIAATPSVIKSISTNGDYTTNRQFTFQLTERDEVEGEEKPEKLNDHSALDVAAEMEKRFVASKVSSYDISTSGNDIVTVTFAANSETHYQQITTYLSFSGSFALVNVNNDLVTQDDFLAGKAYLKDVNVNEYPEVLIPVNTTSSDYTKLIEQARENPVTSSDEEGNETSTCEITMLYNYEAGDTYEMLKETGRLEEKTFLTFDATSDETLYAAGVVNGIGHFSRVCGFSDVNGNGVADPSEVSASFDLADYFCNLINASKLDYDVKCIKGLAEGTKVWVDAKVEKLLDFGNIEMNATLISVIAGIVIISLLLVVFFRLGALNIMAMTLGSSFLTFLFVTLIGLEYSLISILAYALVALVNIVAGVIYCNKIKDEAYKGRTLKKANSEASKKSLLPIIDIHIVELFVGLMLFLVGGVSVHAFGAILILGSLISALLSILGLRGLMWLATNATKLTGKYELFGIESKNVPNHMAEEKQRYYGPYADKDATKNSKMTGIIACVLSILAIVGISTSAGLNNGYLSKVSASEPATSEIYVINEIKINKDDDKASYGESDVNSLLSSIIVYEAGETVAPTPSEDDTHTRLSSYISTVKSFTVQDAKTVEGSTTRYLTTYYEVKLTKFIDGDSVYAKIVDETIPTDTTLNQVLADYFTDYDYKYSKATDIDNSISLKAVVPMVKEVSIDWKLVGLATLISTLIITVYVTLRYRLSRGLTMLIYPLAGSVFALGICVLLSLVGGVLPDAIALAMPVTTLMSFIFTIIVANKERDTLLEDKVKDASIEHRVEVSKKSLSMALTPMFATLVLGVYILINFFGFGPAVTSYVYLIGIIGVLFAFILIMKTYVPLSNTVYKWLSGVSISNKPRKKKKNNTAVKKSAEPEEAIFIGIND